MRKRMRYSSKRQPSAERCPRVLAELEECFAEGERLMGVVRERLLAIRGDEVAA